MEHIHLDKKHLVTLAAAGTALLIAYLVYRFFGGATNLLGGASTTSDTTSGSTDVTPAPVTTTSPSGPVVTTIGPAPSDQPPHPTVTGTATWLPMTATQNLAHVDTEAQVAQSRILAFGERRHVTSSFLPKAAAASLKPHDTFLSGNPLTAAVASRRNPARNPAASSTQFRTSIHQLFG